jgi:ornithine carbamoyltransferase
MTHPKKTTTRQPGTRRHLLSLATLADSELHQLITRSQAYAASPAPAARPLAGCVIGSYFKATSTRTRTAFSSGAARLGATVIAYGPDDLQVNTGETLADTGEVMSRMLDGLVARTAGDPADLQALSAQRRMSVVNAMTADEHPTQAICDLATMAQQFGQVAGIRCLYVGEGNNTAAALALALSRYEGARLDLRTPPGYGLDPGKLMLATAAAQRHGAHVEERHDLDALPAEVDVIYTTRWQTTGTAKPDPDWRDVFTPFRVTSGFLERYPHAVFMHDLPAHRGEEVEAAVLDGPASIAFQQAGNKLYSAMAVLEWCISGPADRSRPDPAEMQLATASANASRATSEVLNQ